MHYDLNQFCNIIATLRKKKGWTQTQFSELLGISPQSISKWECGVGYPDLTLFPVIAELLSVPIGVLFGEKSKLEEEKIMENEMPKVYKGTFEVCEYYEIFLGNTCRAVFIEGEAEYATVIATGDPTFLRNFDVEKDGGTLRITVKNPCGPKETRWEAYDREGYTDENRVEIYTGAAKDSASCHATNYLNLHSISGYNERGNYEVQCIPM